MMRTVRKSLLALLLLGVCAIACDDNTGTGPSDYTALLDHLTQDVILPEQDDFLSRANALASAVADLEAKPTADSLAGAQAAWRDARAAFRRLDAVHLGPIADLGISERIDVAPVHPSEVDALLAGDADIDDSVVAKAGGHAKGFLGLEYLLFSVDGDPAALAPFLTGNAGATRRAVLASAMADEIASSAQQLSDAWTDKGGYASEIEEAGRSSERYPTQRAALDDIVGGVGFALELVVGIRLAEPLGRKSGGAPDPSLDPTPASDSAVADMQASLEGVRALYDGDGFSSRVHERSATLDARMVRQLDDCAADIGSIPAPFVQAVSNDTSVVQSAYDACKAAKSTWNTSVISALGATLKPSDNDGD